MRISELLKQKEVTLSCELFPPKKGSGLAKAHEVVRDMAKLKPAYMSVTYGASGGISEHTVDIANEVQNVNGVTALAHLTCASSGREKIHEVLGQLKEKKIENILALRGDIPADLDFPLPGQYHHASESNHSGISALVGHVIRKDTLRRNHWNRILITSGEK